MNPLLAEFPASADDDKGFAVSYFDWEKHGVHIPYVIFITGRCGSTLLSNLIKDTALAGNPDEFFNEGFITSFNRDLRAETFPEYFAAVVSKFSSNWRFGFEIDWHRLRSFEKLVEFDNVFTRSGATFLYMTRRDIVSQAWSFAKAKATGIWHEFTVENNNSQVSEPPQAPNLGERDIWREMLILIEAEYQMESFFSRRGITPLRLDYEMLISNKKATLAFALLDLGCSSDAIVNRVNDITEKTNKLKNEYFEQTILFRNKFRTLLSEIHNSRGKRFEDLRDTLKEKYNIAP